MYNFTQYIFIVKIHFWVVSKSKKLKNHIKETDLVLYISCLAASALGILLVHSATLTEIKEGNPFSRETFVMLAAVAMGVVICLIISFIDYEIIIKLWPIVAVACIALMISLFFFGGGPENRPDVKSWLKIGGINFQPSELLKIGFIITFAFHIDYVSDKLDKFKHVLLLGIHALIPIGLVMLTGDLGSALVFVAIFICLMFVGGIKSYYFIAGIIICVVAVPLIWIFFDGFQKDRLLAVYFPDALAAKDYARIIHQQQRGLNAIGSGQLFGQGLFKGVYTQNNLVPVQESDMIFTVLGEELGFIGCIFGLLLLAIIILRTAFTAGKSRDKTGSIICYGVAVMIGAQAVINIGVCLKLLPSIGITLPFLSAGGSSNLCVYIGIGLVMSVYRFNKDRMAKKQNLYLHI